MNLTDPTIRGLEPPETGQKDYYDDGLAGFGIRVSQGGSRSFFCFVGGKHSRRRVSIGRYGIITLAQARIEARRLLAEHTLGRVRPQSITYPQAVELFLAEKRKARKARTVDDYERLLNRFNYKGQLSELTHAETQRRMKRFTSKGEFNHLLVALRVFFNWCIKRRYIEHNPTIGLSTHSTKRRTRVLLDQELKPIWITCSDETNDLPTAFRYIVKLLIATGQRRGEIAALRTSFIEGDLTTLPTTLTKNSHQHVFPLPTLASDIIRTVEVDTSLNDAFFFPARGKPNKPFNGWSKSKKLLDELSGVSDWTLHDLRRTFRTNLGKLGVAPHIAERLVNHISAQSDMEQTYDLYKYLPEMRAAMDLWQGHLTKILAV
jgi:integrase